jgi:hypothetical protein
VEDHAEHFGKLGIGVHRDFVVHRQGNPVFYVQNGDAGLVIENLDHVAKYLQTNAKNTDLFSEFGVVCGFLKAMSKRNDPEFDFYDEMEWRVVHTRRLEQQQLCVAQDKGQHIYRLKIGPKDIRILVFPDHETKQMAIEDNEIRDFFKDGSPTMTTVEDCKSF